MRRIRMMPTLAGAAVLSASIAVFAPTAAHAAVPCNGPALVAAIATANGSGGGNITLTPGCTYTLTSPDNAGVHGANGLPVITTTITLTGNNNTIARAAVALPFRIVEVGATGGLTLKSVTVQGGLAATSGGGGIYNAGAVTLTKSALVGNTALLGNGGGIYSGPAASAAATFTGSTLSGNTAVAGDGGGLYSEGGTATVTSGFINGGNTGVRGGGVASVNAVFSITSTPVSANTATATAGGVYRQGGTMTVTTSPITGNSPNNCVGSVPAVPGCTA
ncbi:hypothetical protein SMC26_36080 [Actinomadura fulvescens]|uniref:Polymorphic outer membrane protein n=1 Tax=Actinomadura fulvescens TaxID=46160 RepID=A0ABN3PQV3_9ACTN